MAQKEASMRFWGGLGNMLSLGFILSIVVAMGLSGWIALQEGTHRFMLPFTTENAVQRITDAVSVARAEPTLERLSGVSDELWALSLFSTAKRFTDSKLMEQGIYYATMPKSNQVAIAVHVLFSVFCVMFGGLQFWPAFRKRFMKVHRGIGAIYIATVPVAVVAALCYMALTPPHHIYDHLVAWVALWVFGVLALVSITMAIRALKARRIFEHQAWMALSFGCLLVAPLLRLDWALLVPFFPDIDQETLNLVTMGLMLPEVLLIVYGLVLVNRQYARPMKQRAAAAMADLGAALYLRSTPLIYGIAAALLAFNVMFYVVGHGMSSIEVASALVPAALIMREQSVLMAHPMIAAGFAVACGLAFPAAALTLKQCLSRTDDAAGASRGATSLLTPWLALAAGISSCFLGWRMGLAPHNAWLSGGTMYTVNGLVIAGFGALLLMARSNRRQALMKESLVFLLCLLPFPALFFLTLQIVSWLHLPADYIAAGQGFVLPAGASGSLLFVAIIHVVYGQATREHN
ncbi:DUF2306 domain-containing protein [Burkholderia mayonis]|uniref:DUF2306 domain-containing protein n=1 Tax=Burkholderia mayonis TaxID=1385591 RepID=A0A1B4G7D7_9BURK|nr:DUF2306 domain-containing protein [Burkholderia mayonis]AOJ11840.1 hypothetical protein WS71_19650 [Burkholderia mayonis]KVE55520.1 hypothetical protein WS71_31335 [Burkholderia mayonis]